MTNHCQLRPMSSWDDGALCGPVGEVPPPLPPVVTPAMIVTVTSAIATVCGYLGVEPPTVAEVAAALGAES